MGVSYIAGVFESFEPGQPPGPNSKFVHMDVSQRWEVVRSRHTGKAVIERYIVS